MTVSKLKVITLKITIHLSILGHVVHVAGHELLELVWHVLEGPRRSLGISFGLGRRIVDGLSLLVLILGGLVRSLALSQVVCYSTYFKYPS